METVVIDNGSGTSRAGFAGEDSPLSSFPSVVKRVNKMFLHRTFKGNGCLVGKEALEDKTKLRVKYPIEHGIVVNWDDMEEIWEHIFTKELLVNPNNHPILLTEKMYGPKANREKTIQILFETFNVPAAFLRLQSVLSMYASGRTTGVVLDSGFGVTHTVPIYEGYALPHAVLRLDLGGSDVSSLLKKSLLDNVCFKEKGLTDNLVEDIKRYLGAVCEESGGKFSKDNYFVQYTLPDGTQIDVGTERFQCVEGMFRTRMFGISATGVHENIYNSIMKCDIDIRRDLYSNIVLTGGNTMFKGIQKRIRNEMVDLVPAGLDVDVIAPSERDLSAWRGGTILASLSTFNEIWISKEEYDDGGPGYVHRKCY
eukprot:augustus_masked-scaffold_13-processed-gene-10.6-mRNA-1 protein AED:0.07 eAED:0.07 QI:0/-1/0/1/-1/1/1/0/367